ncbi:50S ribosomal protein L31 [compost metagenome]
MKKGIHPTYTATQVTCACGQTFEVMSNKTELHIEVCNVCHPFNSGEQGKVMKAGRIDKFNRKYGLSSDKKAA